MDVDAAGCHAQTIWYVVLACVHACCVRNVCFCPLPHKRQHLSCALGHKIPHHLPPRLPYCLLLLTLLLSSPRFALFRSFQKSALQMKIRTTFPVTVRRLSGRSISPDRSFTTPVFMSRRSFPVMTSRHWLRTSFNRITTFPM